MEPTRHTLHDISGQEFPLWTTTGGFLEALDDLCAVAKGVKGFDGVPESYIRERYDFLKEAFLERYTA